MAQLVKNPPTVQETGFDPWIRKIPWRREWLLTPVFLPRKSHGQRSLVGYSPWDGKRVGHDLATEPPPPPEVKHVFLTRGNSLTLSHRTLSSRGTEGSPRAWLQKPEGSLEVFVSCSETNSSWWVAELGLEEQVGPWWRSGESGIPGAQTKERKTNDGRTRPQFWIPRGRTVEWKFPFYQPTAVTWGKGYLFWAWVTSSGKISRVGHYSDAACNSRGFFGARISDRGTLGLAAKLNEQNTHERKSRAACQSKGFQEWPQWPQWVARTQTPEAKQADPRRSRAVLTHLEFPGSEFPPFWVTPATRTDMLNLQL